MGEPIHLSTSSRGKIVVAMVGRGESSDWVGEGVRSEI